MAAPNAGGGFRHALADGLEGWEVDGLAVERGEWLGRPAARLSKGGVLVAPFRLRPPYTVEASVAGGAGESYVGMCFHLQDTHNYEAVYLAPHLGGRPEAIQYDAALHGSMTWQVFSGPDTLARAALLRERWHRLRLDVWPDVVRVYVDACTGHSAPEATFALRTGFTSGRMGVWAYLPCYVEELVARPLAEPTPPVAPLQQAPRGTVREWLVGGRTVASEANGALCLNRYAPISSGPQTVECEILVPDGARELALELGYSDRATVWWDNRIVHEGDWRWNPVADADGRVRLGQTTVLLPPSPAGAHMLRVDVGAFEPFGWGIIARVLADGEPVEQTRAD